MAGGLNDLELETETLEEINLSPQPAARPPPAVPARRARRIVSSVALGVTLVLALITWVSLRVDTPPKARAAPDLVSTPPAAADVPEIITPVAVPYGRPHASSHAAQHAHHRHAHDHTHNHTRPHASPAADVAPVSEPATITLVEALPAAPVEPPLLDLLSAPLDFKVSDTAATEMQEVQSVADAAATALLTPLEGSETVTTEDAAATALVDAMAALKEAQAAVAAAEEPIDIQSVSESERRLQEVEMEEPIQAPTPREQEDEPIQAPTPREPEDAEPEIVTPAITRRRLRGGGGGASWWARPLRRLAEATY